MPAGAGERSPHHVRIREKENNADVMLVTTLLQAVSVYEDGQSPAQIVREMKTEKNKLNVLKICRLLSVAQQKRICAKLC